MNLLTLSETTIHWPFKGNTVYLALGVIRDIAWSNEHPVEEMEAMAGRVIFGDVAVQ